MISSHSRVVQILQTVLHRTLQESVPRASRVVPFAPAKTWCRIRSLPFSVSMKSRRRSREPSEWNSPASLPTPDIDLSYLCDPANASAIQENIRNRKEIGNHQEVLAIWKKFCATEDEQLKRDIRKELIERAAELPNTSHKSSPLGDESNAKVIEIVGQRKEFAFAPKTVVQLGENLGMLRTENVSLTTGHRTYYLTDDLADMENALIQFTIDRILTKGFELLSVPELIRPHIIEGCGFSTTGERTQVYQLDPEEHGQLCLVGTAEMPLAGYFMNETIPAHELPIRVAAVSRCFRAETSDVQEEKGIYRVHQFTKVEMFALTDGQSSDVMLQEFLNIEKDIFTELGLYFRILEMPTNELGAPAFRKFDIESWMPAKGFWGELSSCSDCTDYQSRRLLIKTENPSSYVHTVNGTACAVPRMLMTILENNQQQDGSVLVPPALQPYMECSIIRRRHTRRHASHFVKGKNKPKQ